jgi:hypothetical protein
MRTATGSTTHLRGQVGVVEQAARQRRAGQRCASSRRSSSASIARPRGRRRPPRAGRPGHCRRRGPPRAGLSGRTDTPAAGHPARSWRRRGRGRRHSPAGHVSQPCGPIPRRPPPRRSCGPRNASGPTDQVQPAAGRAVGTVFPDRLRRRRGGEVRPAHRDRAARQPYRRSHWPGRRAAARRRGSGRPGRLAGRAAWATGGPGRAAAPSAPVSAAPNERSAVVTGRRP